MITEEQYKVLNQVLLEKYIKVEIYDSNNNKLDSIEGNVIDGTIDIDATSNMRRQFSGLTMVITNNKYIPSSSSYFWINRKVRLAIGIKNMLTDKICWFHLGWYYISKPDIKKTQTTYELTLSGYDYMCQLDGTYNGCLSNAVATKITAGTPIGQAIRSTLTFKANENNYMVEDVVDSINTVLTVPYDLEKDSTSTIRDLISDLAGLYMNYEFFYSAGTENSQPVFTFQAIKNRINDPIVWDFSQNKVLLDIDNQPNFENIKNDVWVWGNLNSDNTQAKAHYQNTNNNQKFSIPNIGVKTYPITETNYKTNAQCLSRAKYEVFLHSTLLEQVQASTIPIYPLDVNEIVNFNNPEIALEGLHLTQKISFNLKTSDTRMTLDCAKLYLYDNIIN